MAKKHIAGPKSSVGARFKVNETASVSSQTMKPKFAFEYLQSSYCISKCEKDDRAALSDALRMLSSITWAQIASAPKHGLGTETLHQSAIHAAIPACVTDDTRLLAFRFSGTKAMVGYRTQEVFYVLWFDRDFTLYDH